MFFFFKQKTAYEMRISDWSSDVCSSDLAFYESGGRLYSMGRGITAGDSKALAAIAWLRAYRPGWEPRNILDMGCAAGGASTVYPAHFPNAEVHAVDLGTSMLRYDHARAESIGVPLHFHQRAAGRRSEKRRVGKEGVSTCSSRGSPYNEK